MVCLGRSSKLPFLSCVVVYRVLLPAPLLQLLEDSSQFCGGLWFLPGLLMATFALAASLCSSLYRLSGALSDKTQDAPIPVFSSTQSISGSWGKTWFLLLWVTQGNRPIPTFCYPVSWTSSSPAFWMTQVRTRHQSQSAVYMSQCWSSGPPNCWSILPNTSTSTIKAVLSSHHPSFSPRLWVRKDS